jgi:hypothetical protein
MKSRIREIPMLFVAQLSGKRGGVARAEELSPKKRRDIAKASARRRWKKT